MARGSDGERVAVWQKRVRRYSRSGLTVAAFCAQEEVSVASFYYWRRKFGAKQRPAGATRQVAAGPVFRPVAVVSASPTMSLRFPHGTQVEVGTSDLNVIRAVVSELVRADQDQVEGEVRC
jgi:transposase-like protein